MNKQNKNRDGERECGVPSAKWNRFMSPLHLTNSKLIHDDSTLFNSIELHTLRADWGVPKNFCRSRVITVRAKLSPENRFNEKMKVREASKEIVQLDKSTVWRRKWFHENIKLK